VGLQPAHAERFHDLVGAVAGVDQDRPRTAENEHAEHRHAADAAAIAPKHKKARFKLDVPVIENFDFKRHTLSSQLADRLYGPDTLAYDQCHHRRQFGPARVRVFDGRTRDGLRRAPEVERSRGAFCIPCGTVPSRCPSRPVV
jgi:hypothetical protein